MTEQNCEPVLIPLHDGGGLELSGLFSTELSPYATATITWNEYGVDCGLGLVGVGHEPLHISRSDNRMPSPSSSTGLAFWIAAALTLWLIGQAPPGRSL